MLLQQEKGRQGSGLQLSSWSKHGTLKVRTIPLRKLRCLEGEMPGNAVLSAETAQGTVGQACAGDLSSVPVSLLAAWPRQ